MDLSLGLVVVVVLALAFDLTNGFHDSSNSLAAPVATRAMTPRQALVVTTVFTLLGPIIAGTAVADTVGGLIEVGTEDMLGILVAALVAAVAWNLLTWRFGPALVVLARACRRSGRCGPGDRRDHVGQLGRVRRPAALWG